jgi:uncharacterized repeat protein (TIGR03803 family)
MTAKVSRFAACLILLLAAPILVTSVAEAQTFSVLFTFTNVSQGFQPMGPLAFDATGNIYGMALYGGGPGNFGTVFRLDTHGNFTVLHSFAGTPDGWWPIWGPVLDKAGTHIFGTTPFGGITTKSCHGECGVIFKVTQTGKETVIYRFGRHRELFGALPQSGIITDATGSLYGTASFGGPTDTGT